MVRVSYVCPHCGQLIPDTACYCGFCGGPVAPALVRGRRAAPSPAPLARALEPLPLTRVKSRSSVLPAGRVATPFVSFPRVVVLDRDSPDNFYCGRLRRIAAGGLFVATMGDPQIGELVRISLRLPGWRAPRMMMGRVEWRREPPVPGMGLSLGALSPEVEADIERYMAIREPLRVGPTVAQPAPAPSVPAGEPAPAAAAAR